MSPNPSPNVIIDIFADNYITKIIANLTTADDRLDMSLAINVPLILRASYCS